MTAEELSLARRRDALALHVDQAQERLAARAGKRNHVEVILGRKGSGKTYTVKSWLVGRDPYIVWDAMSEYGPDDPDCRRLGVDCRVFYEWGAFVADLLERRRVGRASLRLPAADFEKFCRLAYNLGNLLVVIEEVDTFSKPNAMPAHLAELFRRGRHRNLSIWAVSQRPANVHRDLTSQADGLTVFHTREPRDVAYLIQYRGEECAAAAMALAPHRHARFT